ncbi:MAG TPA: ABC transporter ATP-binding protein [Fimbriimonadaceae bacterium]|nr:ABC transporter ATP-binding protein [Fimbriimonadaceae bacterium]
MEYPESRTSKAAPLGEVAIRVDHLAVQYRSKVRSVEAVRDLSFEVREGEVVGFLGPNGAGKSSTIKALIGFLSPAAGTCQIFGLKAGTLEAKATIGYLPEVATYYPFLTPLETLKLYGKLQCLKGPSLDREAKELLSLVGLEQAIRKQNRALSKGMLQRVGIAQSLLGNPRLLILDEVTSGLDPVGRRQLRQILKDRQKKGATLFFSSHELSEVEGICDRILLIDKGSLIDERVVLDLKDALRKYSLRFTGDAPMFGLAQQWSESDGNWIAEFADKERLLEGIDRVTSGGGKVLDVVSQEGSLEDYFVETIGRAA